MRVRLLDGWFWGMRENGRGAAKPRLFFLEGGSKERVLAADKRATQQVCSAPPAHAPSDPECHNAADVAL